MANRYWVGITGTWNTSSTAVWSASAPLSLTTASCSGTTLTTTGSPALVVGMTVWSSTFVSLGTITGGSGNTWTVSTGGTYASQTMIAATTGASIPTSADDVFFTRPSANYTVTLTGGLACNNFSKTGTTITFTSTGNLNISGSFTLSGTTTWSATGQLTFISTFTGNTITTAGASISAATIAFDGVGGSWALSDALTTTSNIVLTNGSLNTAGFAVSATGFASSNSNTRSLTLGGSTLTLTSTTAPWNILTSTGMTLSAGTSSIICSGVLSASSFDGGGLTYNNVSFTSTAQVSSSITGSNTFNTLAITGKTGTGINIITLFGNQTFSTLTLSAGASSASRLFLRSSSIGTGRTLTIGTFTAGSADIDFRDIVVTGAASPISGTRFGDCRGNSGITFPAAKTVYWNLSAGGSWTSTAWALTSGGTAATANFPLAQDTVIIQSANLTPGNTITVNASWNIGTLDMSGRNSSNTPFATGTTTPAIYGDFINGPNVTLSGTGTITFAGRGTQSITSAGVAFTQPVIIDAPGGTVTLADALNIGTNALTVTSGTFNTAGFAVTATSLSSSNTNTRTISLGSSTLTFSGPNSVIFTTSTALTFNCGTSTINFVATSFNGGGQTFYNVVSTSPNGITSTSFTGANTFNSLTLPGRTTTLGVTEHSFSADQTIGTLTLGAGADASYRLFIRSNSIGTTRTLTVGTFTTGSADVDFRDITIAGAASPISGTRFSNCRGNSGITFDAAKTVYWRNTVGSTWGLASPGNWSLTSGGALDATAFPLAQDTAVIPATTYPASASTITVNANYNIGTLDMGARTSITMTLATGTTTPVIYGNWINGTGTTVSGTGTLILAGRGTQTITSAGKTFTQALDISSPGGTIAQQDALVTSNTAASTTITVRFGTLNLNGYNLTQSGASAQGLSITANFGTAAIMVGAGTLTIASTGSTVFSNPSGCSVTGTGSISLTSASAKTFAGGGFQGYPIINQGGAGGLTITGSNKFADITNTYSTTGATNINFTGGTTNTFTAFSLTGTVGKVCTIGSTTTTQAILKKVGTTWNVGANSVDNGNNTGLSFTGSSPDYLSISYINGQLIIPGAPTINTANFFAFF